MLLPPAIPELPAQLVANARVLHSRNALLPLLPRKRVICEIGVGMGSFSRPFLEQSDAAEFIAVDNFLLHEQVELWGRPPSEHFGGLTHRDWYCCNFAAEIESGRMRVLEGDSSVVLETLDDASVDIFYVDGDHSYDGAARDLAVVRRKVKPDGFIIMNDYILVDQLNSTMPYGVIYAAHEFMLQHNWAMQYFVLQTHMFCDVVLRKPEMIESAATHLVAVARENVQLRDEVAILRGSTSWRVTEPLRRIGRLIRGARGSTSSP